LFATEAIANGTDIGTVAKLMGHASPDMVLEHYQHVLTRQKKAAVESLPALDLYGRLCMGKKNGLPIQ
jgi:integrase